MPLLLFASWWKMLEVGPQIFLSVSIVSTILLVILFVYKFLGQEYADENKASKENAYTPWTYSLIIFLTSFGWIGTIGSFIWNDLIIITTLSIVISGIISFLFQKIVSTKKPVQSFKMENVLSSTGKVVRSVPPHRNGFGKIHLNIREAPYHIDAITAGQELTEGMQVKVVEILDDKVVLVESAGLKNASGQDRFRNNALRREPGRDSIPPRTNKGMEDNG